MSTIIINFIVASSYSHLATRCTKQVTSQCDILSQASPRLYSCRLCAAARLWLYIRYSVAKMSQARGAAHVAGIEWRGRRGPKHFAINFVFIKSNSLY